MKKLFYLKFLVAIFISLKTYGQDLNPNLKTNDTTSLKDAFKKGKISGHVRLYYMTTNNKSPLTDYYAFAFGGGLKYQTKSFKGFQLGIGGLFIRNLASPVLTEPDSVTKIMNRYEIGLYDQADPANKKNLYQVEDLFIRYNFKKSYFKFGKQVINTPFVNQQDGRMKPTGEQGFWSEINEMKKTKIELGWLTQISPRGTVNWYRAEESIGIYPAGYNISGSKSNYKDNLLTKGIAIAGVTYNPVKKIKLQAWDYWTDNIFNTLMLQSDLEFPLQKKNKIVTDFQYINQRSLNDGGNANPLKTYFDPSQSVNIYGARIGYQVNNSSVRFNYTRVTKHGRFLFPREWGREPLFTFLSRERNEGSGDVNAFTINLVHNQPKQRLNTEIGLGFYDLPDVKNTRLNKYGLPSYYQFNFDLKYSFNGFMKCVNAELLYLYKKGKGNIYEDLKYVINKTNMHQVNVIFNYYF